MGPYSFLAVLPLVKQIASLCVPAQREEICIGMSAGGSASASKNCAVGRSKTSISNRRTLCLHDPAQLTRHAVRWLPNGSEDHAELRWLETFSDVGKAGSLL